MKKYFTLIAVALLAFSAQSQVEKTLTLGEYDGNRSDDKAAYDGFNNQNSPIVFTYNHSGSQTIYLPEQIADMKEKDIKSVSFSCYAQDSYTTTDYKSSMKLFLYEVDETAFVKGSNGKYLWFVGDYQQPSSTLDFKADFQDASANESNIEITFKLDQPYRYKGKTLLVSVINDANTCIESSELVRFFLVKRKSTTETYRTAVYANDKNDFFVNQALGKDIDTRWAEAPAVKFIYKDTQVPTGIEGVHTTQASAQDVWYNLQGVRIAQPVQSGIYIHNGKKVVIK